MQKQTAHYMPVVDEFPNITSITMPVEGDVQGSRIPDLVAALRSLGFLDVRHTEVNSKKSLKFW